MARYTITLSDDDDGVVNDAAAALGMSVGAALRTGLPAAIRRLQALADAAAATPGESPFEGDDFAVSMARARVQAGIRADLHVGAPPKAPKAPKVPKPAEPVKPAVATPVAPQPQKPASGPSRPLGVPPVPLRRGKNGLNIEMLADPICVALGIEPEDLMGDEDEFRIDPETQQMWVTKVTLRQGCLASLLPEPNKDRLYEWFRGLCVYPVPEDWEPYSA